MEVRFPFTSYHGARVHMNGWSNLSSRIALIERFEKTDPEVAEKSNAVTPEFFAHFKHQVDCENIEDTEKLLNQVYEGRHAYLMALDNRIIEKIVDEASACAGSATLRAGFMKRHGRRT